MKLRLTALAIYALNGKVALNITEDRVQLGAVMVQQGTAETRPVAGPATLPVTDNIRGNTAAIIVINGVEAELQKISETIEVAGSALGEIAANL